MEGSELIYFLTAIIPAGLLILLMLIGDIDLDFGMDIGLGDFHLFSDTGPLGVKAILAFVSGFGLGGLTAESQNWGISPTISGLIFAIILYLGVIAFMRIIYSQRSNTLKSSNTLIGQSATVTVQIPTGQPGEITTRDPETGLTVNMTARCILAKERGTKVKIISVDAGTALVE